VDVTDRDDDRHGAPGPSRAPVPVHHVPYRRSRSRTIDASPVEVWPWLVQMGFDRGGWYAIDVLEKLAGVGRFATGWSARRVVPELQGLTVGDRMPLTRTRWLDVVRLDAPSELVLELPPGRLAWTWRFTLEPLEPAGAAGPVRSRLTITTELDLPVRRAVAVPFVRVLWAVFDAGHGIMEGVQLRTLARRVPAAR
jgi:hypothetical protein